MSSELFRKFEEKINIALEVIETLRLELKEAKETNALLENEIVSFKTRQTQWEKSLSTLLQKLDNADLEINSLEEDVGFYDEEEEYEENYEEKDKLQTNPNLS
jgi:FtsZ-binding cell division protein ZapB